MKFVFSRRQIAIAMSLCAPVVTSVGAAEKAASSDVPVLKTMVISGYVTERTLTGSKMDRPIREIPQSIAVVTEDQITIQGAQSLDQVLGYTAGVAAATGGASRTTDEFFNLRGLDDRFNSTIFIDGSKRTRNSYSGTTEPYALERVEVLKGPASSLYGLAAPGGIINLVTKKPTREPLREVQLQAGTNDRGQLAADFGDALDSAGVWSYRVTGLYRESDTEVDEIVDDRKFLAPSLRFEPSANTSLTLRADYQQDDTLYNYGLPFEGTVAPNPNGDIDAKRFIGEPDLDKWDTKNRSIGYQFEHRFNETLTVRQNFHRFWSDVEYDFTGFGLWTDDQLDVIDRILVMRSDEDTGFSLDTSLQIDFATGIAKHALLVGVDRAEGKFTRQQSRVSLNPLNLFDPVYGQTPAFVQPPGYVEGSDIDQTGLYLQDHIKIGKYVALSGGVRRDDVTLSSDYSEPGYSEAPEAEGSNATTYNAGLVVLTDGGFSPYISYSESFQPNPGRDVNRDLYDPAEGEQVEVGIKYRPENTPVEVSAAVFDINQNDVIVNSFVGYGGGSQVDIESKGGEIELHAELTEDLNVIAAYTYIDAEVTKSEVAPPDSFVRYAEGNSTAAQPEHAASLWGDYRLPMLRALTIGGGVRYIGDTTDFSNQYEVPSYTLFDAVVRYDIDAWRLALNVKNLTDKEYISACTYACYYGDGRTAVVTATYNW